MSFYKHGCSDCHGFSFVTNYAEGDVVCTTCGLIQQGCITVDTYFYNPSSNAYTALVDVFLEKQFNADIDGKLKHVVSRIQLSDHLANEANQVFNMVREKYSFRGAPLNAAIVSAIYIACNIQHTNGISRDAKELCIATGVDFQIFSKVLKHIYELLPEIHHQMQSIKESDTLTRQIQSILIIPDNMAFDVSKEVKKLDTIRKNKLLLMGSPPNVVNAVLIYVACNVLNIKIHKTTYVTQVNISRATLDKYFKLLRDNSVF